MRMWFIRRLKNSENVYVYLIYLMTAKVTNVHLKRFITSYSHSDKTRKIVNNARQTFVNI